MGAQCNARRVLLAQATANQFVCSANLVALNNASRERRARAAIKAGRRPRVATFEIEIPERQCWDFRSY